MSRRTITFLIALVILAIPLMIVGINEFLNPTLTTEQIVQQTVIARLETPAFPTQAIEQQVNATLTAIAMPTATPRSGIDGVTDQVGGFISGSPVLACCVGGLLLVGALYFFSVAKYGE